MKLSQDLLIKDFSSVFELIVADKGIWQERAFALRYQVFCIEQQFEDKKNFPDHLERDTFDEHAVQCLVVFKPLQQIVGMLRIVLPDDQLQFTSFPMIAQNPHLKARLPQQYNTIAELSRFIIGNKRVDQTKMLNYFSDYEQFSANVFGGLLILIGRVTAHHAIEYLCALIDDYLLESARCCGFKFKNLGDPVVKNGMRQPSIIKASQLRSVLARYPSLYALL